MLNELAEAIFVGLSVVCLVGGVLLIVDWLLAELWSEHPDKYIGK